MKSARPLKRSIMQGSILFITALCLLLGLVTFREYKAALYSRYEAYISDLLTYVGSSIDVDDLQTCLQTGTKSQKFEELQAFIDHIKDTHKIDFLYVIIPQHLGAHDNIMNVIAAMSTYEKQYEPQNEVEIGELTGDSYPAETAAKYFNAMDSDGVVFFEEMAEWGDDYTGILPLRTSDGAFFAELCVDVPVSEIHQTIRSHMLVSVLTIIGLGLLFMLAFVAWSTHNIVDPIRRLEKSVTGFVGHHGQELLMEDPGIHTNNELESLSDAVIKMADDINIYVKEVVEAERVASEMRELANSDPLTGIGNKGAFSALMQELQERIDRGDGQDGGRGDNAGDGQGDGPRGVRGDGQDAVRGYDLGEGQGDSTDGSQGDNAGKGHGTGPGSFQSAGPHCEFAIGVFDCDDLKGINDRFGHDKGDEYLKAASGLISRVFGRSQAFRIGGDEFAVVLTGEDFENREALEARFGDECKKTSGGEPWEQVRVTSGIVAFDPVTDRTALDTVRRADQIMYENKRLGKRRRSPQA